TSIGKYIGNPAHGAQLQRQGDHFDHNQQYHHRMGNDVEQDFLHRHTGFGRLGFGEFQRQQHNAVANNRDINNGDMRRPVTQINTANTTDLKHSPTQQGTDHHAAGEEGVEVIELDSFTLRKERGGHGVTGGLDKTITDTQGNSA